MKNPITLLATILTICVLLGIVAFLLFPSGDDTGIAPETLKEIETEKNLLSLDIDTFINENNTVKQSSKQDKASGTISPATQSTTLDGPAEAMQALRHLLQTDPKARRKLKAIQDSTLAVFLHGQLVDEYSQGIANAQLWYSISQAFSAFPPRHYKTTTDSSGRFTINDHLGVTIRLIRIEWQEKSIRLSDVLSDTYLSPGKEKNLDWSQYNAKSPFIIRLNTQQNDNLTSNIK